MYADDKTRSAKIIIPFEYWWIMDWCSIRFEVENNFAKLLLHANYSLFKMQWKILALLCRGKKKERVKVARKKQCSEKS